MTNTNLKGLKINKYLFKVRLRFGGLLEAIAAKLLKESISTRLNVDNKNSVKINRF